MKSVLFLIPTLGGGGAERVLVNLVNNLDKTEYDITLQTIFKAGVNHLFLDPSIKFKEGKVEQFRGNIHVMKLLSPRMLYRMLIGKRYDIVVSYLEGPATRIVAGCPYKDTKLFAWVHVEMYTTAKASRSYRSIEEATKCYNRFNKIVCVAETVKENFSSLFTLQTPICVIYNVNEDQKIIELSKEHIEDTLFSSETNVVTMGRIVPEKCFDRLARVHKRLLDNGIHHHIYHLGNGASDKLQSLINDLRISDTFHLLGFHRNPYKYISKADLFVCSSDREGFSTSVTEALILGVPVVSTNVSGSIEMLGNKNQYGIVTERTDDSLYEGMVDMLSNNETLNNYKQQAAIRGKNFQKDFCIKAVENLFE